MVGGDLDAVQLLDQRRPLLLFRVDALVEAGQVLLVLGAALGIELPEPLYAVLSLTIAPVTSTVPFMPVVSAMSSCSRPGCAGPST